MTITSPFDTVTGLHLIVIDTSNDTGDVGFWTTGSDYTAILVPDETVDAQTVVRVLAQFSIENRAGLLPTVSGRKLDVSAGGEAGIDWANIGSPTTAQNLSATNIDVDQVVASVSGAVGSVSGAVGSIAANGITATSIATGAIDTNALATDAVDEIVDQVWNEAIAGHVGVGSFGEEVQSHSTTTEVAAVETDTQNIQTRLPAALVGGRMDSDIGAKTGNVALSVQEKLDVNTEIDAALDTAIPGVPVADSINQRIRSMDLLTEAGGAGDLAAILVDTGTTLQGEVDGIQADTEDIQTRLPAALVLGRMSSDAVAISGSTVAADNVEANITNLDATVSTRATPAQVNAEVLDVLNTDTFAEPAGVPGATVTLATKLGYLFMALRNRLTVSSTKKTFFSDADVAQWEKDLSDNGTTYDESEGNIP